MEAILRKEGVDGTGERQPPEGTGGGTTEDTGTHPDVGTCSTTTGSSNPGVCEQHPTAPTG